MHRKNRRNWKTLIADLSDKIIEHCEDEGDCEGVDLNRNFPAGWGLGHPDFEKKSSRPWTSQFKGIERKITMLLLSELEPPVLSII